MKTKFWIEKVWGGSIDNATIADVDIAFEEIKLIVNEQRFFWIGYGDEEYVLEIHENLDVFYLYGEDQDKSLKAKFNNWVEVRHCVEMYFANDFLLLKNRIELFLLRERSIKKDKMYYVLRLQNFLEMYILRQKSYKKY